MMTTGKDPWPRRRAPPPSVARRKLAAEPDPPTKKWYGDQLAHLPLHARSGPTVGILGIKTRKAIRVGIASSHELKGPRLEVLTYGEEEGRSIDLHEHATEIDLGPGDHVLHAI